MERIVRGLAKVLRSPPLTARPVAITLLEKNDRAAASSTKEGKSEKVFIFNELELKIWACFAGLLYYSSERTTR